MKMINIILSIVLCTTLFSCAKGEKVKFVSVPEASFSKFVNSKDLPTSPNLSVDKTIINNSYPIEISLYQNKMFYYDLPNLGDGIGSWEYKDGHLKLRAHRDIFDMYIEVHATDESAELLALSFTDRHGFNVIKMQNNNL